MKKKSIQEEEMEEEQCFKNLVNLLKKNLSGMDSLEKVEIIR